MARRPRRSPTRGAKPLGDAVWRLVKTIVPAHLIRLMHARNAWDALNLPWLRGRAYPLAVIRGELIVVVENSQYHHDLMYSRHELLHKLQQLAPDAFIESLRFRLGPVPPAAPAPVAPVVERLPATMSAEPGDVTRRALDGITDPELRQVIAGARIMLGRD